MAQWSNDQKRRFADCLRRAAEEAAGATARTAVGAGDCEPAKASAVDPGSASGMVETPGGQAKVIREEEDGELLIWMCAEKLNVKVPADLLRSQM
ncbi:MAG: hypothetical protein ACLQUT_13335 [Thermoleophilia bacterium]